MRPNELLSPYVDTILQQLKLNAAKKEEPSSYFDESSLGNLSREFRQIDSMQNAVERNLPRSIAPEAIQQTPSQPTEERIFNEPLIPGRDAMIMRNIMRASEARNRPSVMAPPARPVEIAAPAEDGAVIPAAVTEPKRGDIRVIENPRGGGELTQYYTGIPDLGWQSREALQDYVRRTNVAQQEVSTSAARETPVTSRPEQSSRELRFGEPLGNNRFYAGPNFGPQSRAGFERARMIEFDRQLDRELGGIPSRLIRETQRFAGGIGNWFNQYLKTAKERYK